MKWCQTCEAQLYKFKSELFCRRHGTELVPIYHHCHVVLLFYWVQHRLLLPVIRSSNCEFFFLFLNLRALWQTKHQWRLINDILKSMVFLLTRYVGILLCAIDFMFINAIYVIGYICWCITDILVYLHMLFSLNLFLFWSISLFYVVMVHGYIMGLFENPEAARPIEHIISTGCTEKLKYTLVF